FVLAAVRVVRRGSHSVAMLWGRVGASALEPPLPEVCRDAPALVPWMFGALALLAGAGALALAVWVAFSERLTEWWMEAPREAPPPPLVEAVEESVEDLSTESDPRRAIIRCYARFERLAGDNRLARRAGRAPMEFLREALSRLQLPRSAAQTLTGLFELARFSSRALGEPERSRALRALDEIRATVPERAEHATAQR